MPAPLNKKKQQPVKKTGRETQADEALAPAYTSRIALAGILIVTAFLYSKALNNGITNFDDDFYILNNPYIRDFSWDGVKAIFTHFYSGNYHPLTSLTNLFEFRFFELNPLPYHLFNVLLHLLNTWLVFKVTEQLSGRQITALVAALLFAVHPMHVESVAWISERKDVLYAAFYLLSLLAYFRYLDSGRGKKQYFIALLLFLLSLLSKSAAVTLPVLLVAIDLYKSRKINTISVSEKIPFFLLAILFGVLNIMSQRASGALNDMSAYGFINRVFLSASGLSFYIVKLVAPLNQAVMHYFPILNGAMLPLVYYLSIPFLLVLIWFVIRRNSLRKEVIFGVCFFLITISVMLQIVAVGSALTAERYTYIPYIGLFYIAGQWLSYILDKQKYVKTTVGVFAVFVVFFCIKTWYRIGVWKDDHLLVADMIESNPEIYYGYWMKGNLDKREGKLNEAYADYTRAIELNPTFEEAYYNRGVISDRSGNLQAAIADYNQAIRINPAMSTAYNNRGWIYFESGDKNAALHDFNKAISLKPEYAEAYNNRGWLYLQSGDTRSALADFNKATEINPAFERPYYNRAILLANAGDYKAAIQAYDQILQRHPDDHETYYYRGLARFSLKDITGACGDWKHAAELGNTKAPQMLSQYCR